MAFTWLNLVHMEEAGTGAEDSCEFFFLGSFRVNSSFLGTGLSKELPPNFESCGKVRDSEDLQTAQIFSSDLNSVQFDFTNEVKYLNRRVNCRE